MAYFRDRDFQERLLALLSTNRKFIRKTVGLLTIEDFKQRDNESDKTWGWARETTARIILDYWKDYRQPIGGMLKTFALDEIRAKSAKLGSTQRKELLTLVEKLKDPELAVAADAMELKIVRYKERQQMRNCIDEMLDLQATNELTPEEFRRLASTVMSGVVRDTKAIEYKTTIDERIKRRESERDRKYPKLYIDPLDVKVRCIPRGQVGMVLAKYKKGKSAFFVHLAQAFAYQGLKVMFFTLEDPKETVEDRLDSSLCGIRLQNLPLKAYVVRKRFLNQIETMQGSIKVVDGTGGGWTVERMIQTVDQERNRGWETDVVLVDYDEQIEPPHRFKGDNALRMQSHEIYIELVRWAARDQIWLWTASQATIAKYDKVIITGDEQAEDKSKIRKVGICLSIGAGPAELGDPDNTRYLYVAANRFGRMMIGWPIVGEFNKAIFYDQEETERAIMMYSKGLEKGKK